MNFSLLQKLGVLHPKEKIQFLGKTYSALYTGTASITGKVPNGGHGGHIMRCRGEHNRLGFAYQLAFVRLLNRFPAQVPFEIEENILTFASVQLNTDIQHCDQYGGRQQTISEHQESIRHYLSLSPFRTAADEVEVFLFKEASQLEQTAPLSARLKEFLRIQRILEPSQDTIFLYHQIAGAID